MSRRRFLQASALLGAGAGMGGFAMTAAHGQVTRGGTGPHVRVRAAHHEFQPCTEEDR